MKVFTPQAFAKRWAGAALSKRASYQQHFLDLCAVLGAPGPAEADPTEGGVNAFEKGVEKTGGGQGFADVWYEGRFAFEYKGRHKDLKAAYAQLLQYREPLGNPPLLVVTDTQRYEIHTNFTGTVKRVYRFTNAELPRPENLRVLRALFEDSNWRDPEGASEAELKKRTLTNLYNARPSWLQNAHARLDGAVYAAYGWPAELADEEVLKNLLALNLKRSADGS